MKFGRYIRLLNALMIPLLAPLSLSAQTLPSASVSLQQLNTSAGAIFSGTVLQIERVVTADAKPAFVRVKFRVDEAVRGCRSGDMVTLDEWAELWVRGDRYRKGQRLVVLLYPPSQTGVSSAVAGGLGTFFIGPDGLLRATPQQTSSFASQATNTQPGAPTTHGESDPQIPRRGLRRSTEQRKIVNDEAVE